MMPYFLNRLAFILLCGALAAPAAAEAPPEDVRCLIVSNVFAKAAKEEAGRRRATMAAFYYLGRVTAQTSASADIKASIAAQGPSVSMANSGVIMTRCATRMDEAAKTLQSVAQQLSSEQRKRQ